MDTTTPTPDERARFGEAIVREYLAHATPQDTPKARARRGGELAQLNREDAARLIEQGLGEYLIIGAVINVLHLADGWHTPERVLTRAFGIYWAQDLPADWSDAHYGGRKRYATPRVPEPDADPRDWDAMAGAVADLYAAAADQFDDNAEDVADVAETDFWDQVEV